MKLDAIQLSLAACLFWGLQAVSIRLAVTHGLSSFQAVGGAMILEGLICFGLAWLLPWKPIHDQQMAAVLLTALAGISGLVGYFCFGLALEQKTATAVIVGLASSYPLVVMLGMWALTGETLRWRDGVAVAMMVAAVVVVVTE